MKKITLLLIVFVSLLVAAPEKVEIYAGNMQSQNNIVSLHGDIVVIYGDYILTAKRAKYNRNKGILELFDNVIVTSEKKYKILGDYARLDLKNKKRTFKPFYMLDKPTKVWMSAKEGCDIKEEIDISKGTVSGCDPQNPLWQIEFTSSDYNKETKWLNLYNTVFYLYDIPVFYTPYFGYSLDRTRRSGLLTPAFGYSDNEGIYYEQPLYIAPQSWWDLELKPQMRTKRGAGMYGTFRFVDTKYSKGSVDFGYFKEKDKYFIENGFAHQEHYGMDFYYDNTNLLKSFFNIDSDAQTALYIDATNMNDVEYINLATNNPSKYSTASQTISRANLFYNSDKNYLASYIKYYVDLNQESNARTIQQLPSLQYHRYLETFFQDHLLYNFDARTTYYYREEGSTATQTNLFLPVKLRTSLLDEYLNISADTYFYAQHSKFQNTATSPVPLEDGYYLRNYNKLSVSTQLTKPYSEHIHTVSLSASYVKKGAEKSNGFYEENKDIDCSDPVNSEVCSFYKLTNTQDSIALNFSQFLFDSSGKQIVYHRLSDIITDPGDTNSSFGVLENELDYAITNHISFYNNFFYSFKDHLFTKQFNRVKYDGYGFKIALSHLYQKSAATKKKDSYLTSSLSYKYNNHYTYFGRYDYDLELDVTKRVEVGFLYDKRCWSFGLRYSENNRPILTNDNKVASVYDRYLYVTLLLKPFMKPSASDFFGFKLSGGNDGSNLMLPQ